MGRLKGGNYLAIQYHNVIIILEIKIIIVSVIALLTIQCFQIPLTPRMFPFWDFVVGIFVRKASYYFIISIFFHI